LASRYDPQGVERGIRIVSFHIVMTPAGFQVKSAARTNGPDALFRMGRETDKERQRYLLEKMRKSRFENLVRRGGGVVSSAE